MSVSDKMKGNTNAESWTLEQAQDFCREVYDILLNNKSLRTLGGACLKAGGYETLIYYLQQKFDTEFEPIKKAKEIVKERLIEQGLDGDANPTMAIFILKNNHDMKDRVDHTTDNKAIKNNESIKVEFVDFSEDED